MNALLHDCLSMFGLPGGSEWIVILAVALLLFGKKLPEVARSLGKGIVEFKKGLREVEDEVERASSSVDYAEPSSHDDSDAATRQNYDEIYGQSEQDSYDGSSLESSSAGETATGETATDETATDETATDETATDETMAYETGNYEPTPEDGATGDGTTEDEVADEAAGGSTETATEPGNEVTTETENS